MTVTNKTTGWPSN